MKFILRLVIDLVVTLVTIAILYFTILELILPGEKQAALIWALGIVAVDLRLCVTTRDFMKGKRA